MQSVENFLAHAIQLETDAADRFGQLADAMESSGNREVSALFRQLAGYSRLHLADARERAGFRSIPDLRPDGFTWPDVESPESAAIWAADPMIGPEEALETALEAELAGLNYYASVLGSATDPEVVAFAREFAEEEAEHVEQLRMWIRARKAGKVTPTDS